MTLAVLALALCAAPISARTQAPAKADKIDGAWAMTITGPDGSPMAVTAVFKTDGKKVTGTLTSQMGDTPLEGEYAGGKLAFGIAFESQEGPMHIGFAGDMKDDGSFAGMASGPFGEIAWSAVRAKT